MPAVGLTTWIWENQLKTTLLVLLFPVLLFSTIFGVLFLYFFLNPVALPVDGALSDVALETQTIPTLSLTLFYFQQILFIGLPLLLIWFFVSISFHRQIVFSMVGAQAITRKEMPDLYNTVENLCISRGLPMPQIGVMNETGMNAFATGWNPKKSWIVFSRGLLENLEKEEIEAVAAHELTHIINRDVKLMTILVVFIGILGTLGYVLLRFNFAGGSRKKDGRIAAVLLVLGITLYLFSLLIFPFIQLAISRKREFMADAGAVELTKDNQAMISALQKISGQSEIQKMQNRTLSALCIETPKKKTKKSWFSSHPTIEERVSALQGL